MQTTDNYSLNLYEGNDYFNPLTVENVNSSKIDEVLKDNADNSVTTANHLKSNTIHALTRTNGDARMFTFRATSRYEIGDSFTVDGVAVTALTVGGGSIPGGAFVIGSIVLCSLVGQQLTVYGVGSAEAENAQKLGGELPSFYAKQSELSATTSLAENTSTISRQNSSDIATLMPKVDSVTHSGYGNPINIASYNSVTNVYTVPTDGVARVSVSYYSGSYAYTHILNADGTDMFTMHVSSNSNYTMRGDNDCFVPVFKGMKLWCTGEGTHIHQFLPFV